jgi:hypothetical protein
MLDRFVIASLPQAMNRRTRIGAERSDARSLRHCVIASSPRMITRRTDIGAERSDARSIRHCVIAAGDNPQNPHRR